MDTSPRESVFPLLSLPPELRSIVFHYALLWETQPVRICSSCSVARPVKKHLHPLNHMTPNFLAIFLVSKQVYHEAMPVFYRHNTFLAAGATACTLFLRGIGPERRAQIRDLTCRIGLSLFSYGCLKYLGSCTGLRSLRIQAFSQSLIEQKRGGAFDNLHGFGTVTVTHRGRTIGVSHSRDYRIALGREPEPSTGRVRSSRIPRIVKCLTSKCPPSCQEHKKKDSLINSKVKLCILDLYLNGYSRY